MDSFQYWYTARVLRIVDGDTVDVEIDLGFSCYRRERIRLYGVDTPETYGVKKDSEEYRAGLKAKEFVEAALVPISQGEVIRVETIQDKQGKYGRYLANVYYKKSFTPGESARWVWLNQELVNNGLAERKEY